VFVTRLGKHLFEPVEQAIDRVGIDSLFSLPPVTRQFATGRVVF